jgi:deoxyguanosine kinase
VIDVPAQAAEALLVVAEPLEKLVGDVIPQLTQLDGLIGDALLERDDVAPCCSTCFPDRRRTLECTVLVEEGVPKSRLACNASRCGLELTGDEFEDRRLAGAIAPDDPPPFAFGYGCGDILEEFSCAEGDADVGERQQGHTKGERDSAENSFTRSRVMASADGQICRSAVKGAGESFWPWFWIRARSCGSNFARHRLSTTVRPLGAALASYCRMTPPLIGFEGPIGAGKTTIATLLARHTGYDLVLEKFDENEFLSDFYSNRERWALPMQLWFLAERHKQLVQISESIQRPIVADYTGLKNDVFAALLLKDREARLFANVASGLARAVRQPDIVAYLDANNVVLLERIRLRDRPYEARIDAPYLDGLRQSYEAQLAERPDLRVVRFDTGTLDLNSPTQLEQLFQGILHPLAH